MRRPPLIEPSGSPVTLLGMFPTKGAIALVTTVLALILLITFKTPDDVPVTTGSSGVGDVGSGTDTNTGVNPATTADPRTSPAPGSTPSATKAPSASAAPAAGNSTVTGDVVSTRYGDVEVSVTIADGKVASVQAVELPTDGRSGRISDYAGPILASEALQAQSAQIDIVSGATYTSEAYTQSLQSALDQAGIAAATSQIAA
jgi:uncharacterized protein with FMN-binding domain